MPGKRRPARGGVIVDASVFAAILFREPNAVSCARFLATFDWVATTQLLLFEVCNVGIVKVRRGELSIDEAARLLRSAVFPPVRTVNEQAAFRLAERLGLTYYDASYVSLAAALNVPLVTLDAAMLRAEPLHCLAPV